MSQPADPHEADAGPAAEAAADAGGGRLLAHLRRLAYEEAGPLPAVALRPADAVGHVLRESVDARVDLPPHELVAADGWAVAGPGPWQLVAASPADAVVPDGSAVAVLTGAPLPPGTSGVVALAEGEISDGRLHLAADGGGGSALGRHVRARAAEVAAGMLLIPEGTVLTPGAVALAAAGGNPDVLVTGRPSVTLLATQGGDPHVDAALEALLPALLRAAGAVDVVTRSVPDSTVALRASIDAASADVVVVTGIGAERARHLDRLLAEARVDVVVDGALDAGGIGATSAWLLARMRDGRLLVALPGEIRSAVAATVTLLRPLVHGLCGYGEEPVGSRTVEVDLAGDGERPRFAFVRGTRPTPDHGPATGHGVAAADALVLVPTHGAAAGSALPGLPLL